MVLSINHDVLPTEIKEKGQRTFRSIKIEGEELEFSGGFTDLHTKVYMGILDGELRTRRCKAGNRNSTRH